MARIHIAGIGIEYELLGEPGAPAVALTPGGRFSKDTPGLRELGEALVAGGRRVLLWDRPNCGASDICFEGETESALHGRTLTALIRELDLGPTALAAGSAGSRVSMIAAASAPNLVSHLVLWWISGGPIGLMQLAAYYCGEAATAASLYGMTGVLSARSWAEQLQMNPRTRDALLECDPLYFIETMQRWALAYRPPDDSPVPGMQPEDFKALKIPVLILRNGVSDLSHTRATSDWVHKLLPQSLMIDPPWPDTEWNDRTREIREGKPTSLFGNWPALAPSVLDFIQT